MTKQGGVFKMKHKIIMLLTTMILVMVCGGCGQQLQNMNLSQQQEQQEQKQKQEQEQKQDTNASDLSENTENVNPANGEELFEISKLNGSVMEISDDGCKITPTHTEDDVAYEAAPGYESQEELITVTYDEGCTFQIAYVNIQTGAATYDTASISDVKKQTRLVICGEYDSDNVLHANLVFIYRNME